VQKYGGSSVADADSIKRVAKRIVATKQQGHDVVVVISAMGDTTDDLMSLALEVTPLPPPRELDMLLTAGERMSAALLAMAIHDHGMHARSLTGSQAGIITTGTHGNARIIDITPGRITSALDRNDIVIVAGFQGVAQDTKDVTTLGRGASDTTAVALAASLGADHCEIYTDANCGERSPHSRDQLRGNDGDGSLRRQDLASTVRRVCAPRKCPSARAVLFHR
jgi:aspartate kinase